MAKNTKQTVINLIGTETPTLAVSVWNKAKLPLKYDVSKSGAPKAVALTRLAWKRDTGSSLTGNALKRAHNDYLRQVGLAGNEYVSGLMATGKIAVSAISSTKTGNALTVKFINAATLVDPAPAAPEPSKADSVLDALVKSGVLTADQVAKALAATA